MSLTTYYPAPPLSDYIHMLWCMENYHPPHTRERILPFGSMEITVNLTGEPFILYDDSDNMRVQTIQEPMLTGARTRHFVIDTSRPATILAVWFKPGGALPFLNMPATEVHNWQIPLADVWGAMPTRDLYERLLNAPSTQMRFKIMEQALLQQFQQSAARHRAVNYGLRILSRSPQTKITQLVDSISLSQTRFIKVFRDDVGMTPKMFTRVMRFQQSLAHITQQKSPDWIDIALRAGYYDQAHFINDFRHFAGISPTAYAPQDAEHFNNLAFEDQS